MSEEYINTHTHIHISVWVTQIYLNSELIFFMTNSLSYHRTSFLFQRSHSALSLMFPSATENQLFFPAHIHRFSYTTDRKQTRHVLNFQIISQISLVAFILFSFLCLFCLVSLWQSCWAYGFFLKVIS